MIRRSIRQPSEPHHDRLAGLAAEDDAVIGGDGPVAVQLHMRQGADMRRPVPRQGPVADAVHHVADVRQAVHVAVVAHVIDAVLGIDLPHRLEIAPVDGGAVGRDDVVDLQAVLDGLQALLQRGHGSLPQLFR
jgi:hypothetical protein